MSLTIGKGTNTIKIKGTDLTLDSVYAFIDISSNVKGKINSALKLYATEEDFDTDNPQINVDINGSQIITDVPKGQKPGLSLAENDWKTKLEDLKYIVTIN